MPLVDVPITVTNAQGTDTPAPFQQMIQFNPSLYSPFLMSDLSNIRFTDEDYSALLAWLESYSSTSATAWVKLNDGIKAGQSRTLHMLIGPVGFDGQFWGEAPQLSPTYGQYDSGASIFNNYWNFSGTSWPSGLYQPSSGSSFTVNNGLNVTWNSGDNYMYFTNPIPAPQIVEILSESSYSTAGPTITLGEGPSTSGSYAWESNSYDLDYYSSTWRIEVITSSPNRSPVASVSGYVQPVVYGFVWVATENEKGYINYNTVLSASDTTNPWSSSLYPYLGIDSTSSGSYLIQWLRTRAYPPNGVMPGVTVGSPKIYNYGYTVYPAVV